MKLIQVVGHADSGKTTFIGDLLTNLRKMGEVAAVKHLGHHHFALEEGKDTTLFYEKGAGYSIGIDSDKAVGAIRNADLEQILDMLCEAGVEFTIIEGFKQKPLPKIIIGDLPADNCVLRNPSVEQVIDSLDLFEDYFTMQGLVRELKKSSDMNRAGAILTFNGIVREYTGDQRTEFLDFDETVDAKVRDIVVEMEKVKGILGVRFHHRKGRLYAGEDITYIAVVAEHRQEALATMSAAIDRLKRELHDVVQNERVRDDVSKKN